MFFLMGKNHPHLGQVIMVDLRQLSEPHSKTHTPDEPRPIDQQLSSQGYYSHQDYRKKLCSALLKESTDQGVLLFLCAHTPTESVSVRRKYKNKNMILAKVTRSRFTGCPLAFAVLHLFDFWKGKEEDRKKVNISSIEPGSLECRNPMAILSLLCTRRRLRSQSRPINGLFSFY